MVPVLGSWLSSANLPIVSGFASYFLITLMVGRYIAKIFEAQASPLARSCCLALWRQLATSASCCHKWIQISADGQSAVPELIERMKCGDTERRERVVPMQVWIVRCVWN